MKSPWRSCCGGPVSLDHSIDPIVPPARTAAARIACLVLVCFMEDFIVRAQPCASCLWAVDLNQQPAWLVWKRDRALIFMTATLSFGSGRTSGINHTRQKTRAFNFQGISNRRFNDCLNHAYVGAARDAISAFACPLSFHRVRRLSLNSASFDCFASPARKLSSAFSTEICCSQP